MSNKSGISDQVISLPKGGGALHGIGEKFSPDLHTGTGNFTVPIDLPPGRNGFQPQLSLVYSSGSGNGPFGLGWNLSIPGVSRKTSKGIPLYDDSKDVFVLSGAEDLVPVSSGSQGITRYRPRTEGLFARIEHHRDSDDDYWKVWSKDGLISFYGTPGTAGSDPTVLADPDQLKRTKVFSWKLTETKDTFENIIKYEYERDLGEDGPHQWDQLYLKRIQYADYTENDMTEFLVSVTFEYEDRPDHFSEYRSGYEIRTRKRCKRIEIRTNAEEELLVRTYNLVYLDQRDEMETLLPINGVSLLSQIRVIGHDYDSSEELPPLEFGYTQFEPDKREFFPFQGLNLPANSLANPRLELADLSGNGLPDILEMNGVVRYWRNLGDGRFDLPREMNTAPSGLNLADKGVQLIDANGDGRIDLMVTNQSIAGYYPMCFGGMWDRLSFQRYRMAPSFDLEDPEVKLVDLDGDGITDAIRSGSRLECFFNDPHEGWNKTRWVERQTAEKFPDINFSDPRVKWADMTGDGMQDIVLIHDGNIEYWPNLGYGNWGKRVSMKCSPHFPYGYNPSRILVGDVDGDGLADIVYVDDTKITLWINQSGNKWSDPIEIIGTPSVSDMDAVRLADMLGTGVSGVLWSSDASGRSRENMFFLDFTGGIKPYLLNEMDNQIGSITRVSYAPSTRFYLADEKRLETRWRTSLPFPVQVVARVEVIDQISKGKLTTEYIYHHGYWDGAEREFRGFGRVDQRDTEIFEDYHAPGLHPQDRFFEAVPTHAFSPPTETRTWFHQGPVGNEFGEWEEIDFSGEFWKEPWPRNPDSSESQVLSRPQYMVDFLNCLPRRVKRDAFRALRGSILRTELYAVDGTARQDRPYNVTESLYGVCEVIEKNDRAKLVCRCEPSTPNIQNDYSSFRIFFPHTLTQRTTQWERGDDPMTQFTFTDDYDNYGQARSQIITAVPRGRNFLTAATPSEPYLATHTVTTYAQRDDSPRYIVNRVASATTYEILNDGSSAVFTLRENIISNSVSHRIIGQTLNYYDRDPSKPDNGAFLGLTFGQIGDYGALVRTESLVLTEEIIHDAYKSGGMVLTPPEEPPYLTRNENPLWTAEYPEEFRNLLPLKAGYIFHMGGTDPTDERGYFVLTNRRHYDFHNISSGKGRGMVRILRDPLGHDTSIAYDRFDLLPTSVIDPAGLKTKATYDYRVLQPREVIDPNGNQTVFTFTPMGLLSTTSIKGKAAEGDQQRPSVQMKFDFMAFVNNGLPISVRISRQIHHDSETDVLFPENDETIESIEYSDGFGRLLQTRTQTEDVIFGDSVFGNAVLPSNQLLPIGDAFGQERTNSDPLNFVVSGWQVYNNKGLVVEKYEPFFSIGYDYATPTDSQRGQKIKMFYDPRGHVIRTIYPDASEQRVVYGVPGTVDSPELNNPDIFEPTPWEAYTYDANDNAGRTHLGDPSVKRYEHQWNTPTSLIVDALGRIIETVERNREKQPGGSLSSIEELHTKFTYDIQGNLLTVIDALGRVAFKHVYDLTKHPLRIENIDAGIRRIVMDAAGSVIEHRDSKDALILHAYDILNRPIRLWARDGTGQKLTLRERMEYGDDGDPNQSSTERNTNYIANRLGKLTKHYDEAGVLTLNVYDFKGNVLEKTRRVISDEKLLAIYNPPPSDWQVQVFRVDWQPSGGITLENYANGQLEPTSYTSSLTYDAMNRIKTMRYPQDSDNARKELRPRYNCAGALEHVKLDEQIYVEHIAYNAKGQRILIAYGNNVMTRYAYNPKTFRLVRMRTELYKKSESSLFTYQPTDPNNPLQDIAYKYDLVGNILNIHDRTPDSGTQPLFDQLDRTFTYDSLYRLCSATGRECEVSPLPPLWNDMPRCTDLTLTRDYKERFHYDSVGNIMQMQHHATSNGFTRDFKLVPDTNRLFSVTIGMKVYSYDYDANGNLIQENIERYFEWDHSDRMRVHRTQSIGAEPSVHAQYLYDASGQRLKKLVRKKGGKVEVTVYVDGVFEHHRIIQSDIIQENNNLHVMDNVLIRIGNPFLKDTTPAVKYYIGDHLGSSNVVIDDNGALINREEYTPYGETSFGSFSHKRYRFTGKERDEENGLYYYGARYYAPWLGRWSSCDPAGVVDGYNLYLFVRNNPLNFADSRGTDSIDVTNCPGGCHKPQESFPKTDFTSIPQKQLEDFARAPASGSAPAEQPLPTLEEQGVGEPPSRFGIQCVGDCHNPTKIQGHWTGMEPATAHEPPWTAKFAIAGVMMMPGVGTLAHLLIAVDAGEKGKTGTALWSLAGAALTLAPVLGSTSAAVVADTAFSRGSISLATNDAAAFARQLDEAQGTRIFYSGPSIIKGENVTVAARFNGNRVSFDRETDLQFTEVVFRDIERNHPGVPIISGSGTHGTMEGRWAATDASQAIGARKFYFQDIKSLGGRNGPNYVYNVGTTKGISGFLSQEQAGSGITVRSWCYSTLSD